MYIRQNTSPLPVTLTRVPAPQRLTASTHWRPISPCRAGQIMFVCLLSLLLGCGRIAVYKYEGNSLKPEMGIKFYTPKPYLLVSRTGAKEKPIEVKLIYLPDVSVPYYAKLKPGMGSADLSLTFENGSLKTVGQNTDPQIDELVTALGSFATSAREAIAPLPPPTPQSDKLPELSRGLEKVADDLDAIRESLEDDTFLENDQKHALMGISGELRLASENLEKLVELEQKNEVVQSLKGLVERWETSIDSSNRGDKAQKYPFKQLTNLRGTLESIIEKISKEIKGEPAPKAEIELKDAFELYEIRMENKETKRTILHKVDKNEETRSGTD